MFQGKTEKKYPKFDVFREAAARERRLDEVGDELRRGEMEDPEIKGFRTR